MNAYAPSRNTIRLRRGLGVMLWAMVLVTLTGCCGFHIWQPTADLSGFDRDGATAAVTVGRRYPVRVAVAQVTQAKPGDRQEAEQVTLALTHMADADRRLWIDQVSRWPKVSGAMVLDGYVNRFDGTQRGLIDLARRDGADVLLVYALTTNRGNKDHVGTMLFTMLTLGLLPNIVANADSVAVARLVDVHSGFVYRSLGEDYHAWQPANMLTADDADVDVTARAPRQCLKRLVKAARRSWLTVVQRYPPGTGVSGETGWRFTGRAGLDDRPVPAGARYDTAVGKE